MYANMSVPAGCYRGQYKNGLRSGFGTRTSAAYEHRDKGAAKLPDHTSSPSSKHKLSNFINPFKRPSYAPPMMAASGGGGGEGGKPHSDALSSGSTTGAARVGGVNEEGIHDHLCNMQIYEGEWKEDKRHGYGVIKCLGSYTYYGQWCANARTGYGVLITECGTKEEGQWQNGELLVALKRKKLQIKSHQLETKVQTAHTQAIQAAGGARDKAMLAESRAATAMSKAKMAQGVAMTAEKNAKLAREKAEQYKNATRISGESLLLCCGKTPPTSLTESF